MTRGRTSGTRSGRRARREAKLGPERLIVVGVGYRFVLECLHEIEAFDLNGKAGEVRVRCGQCLKEEKSP